MSAISQNTTFWSVQPGQVSQDAAPSSSFGEDSIWDIPFDPLFPECLSQSPDIFFWDWDQQSGVSRSTEPKNREIVSTFDAPVMIPPITTPPVMTPPGSSSESELRAEGIFPTVFPEKKTVPRKRRHSSSNVFFRKVSTKSSPRRSIAMAKFDEETVSLAQSTPKPSSPPKSGKIDELMSVVAGERIVEAFVPFYIKPQTMDEIEQSLNFFSRKEGGKNTMKGLLRNMNVNRCHISLGKFKTAGIVQAMDMADRIQSLATETMPGFSLKIREDCGGIQVVDTLSDGRMLLGITFVHVDNAVSTEHQCFVDIFNRIRAIAESCGAKSLDKSPQRPLYWTFASYFPDKIVDRSMPDKAHNVFNEIFKDETAEFNLCSLETDVRRFPDRKKI